MQGCVPGCFCAGLGNPAAHSQQVHSPQAVGNAFTRASTAAGTGNTISCSASGPRATRRTRRQWAVRVHVAHTLPPRASSPPGRLTRKFQLRPRSPGICVASVGTPVPAQPACDHGHDHGHGQHAEDAEDRPASCLEGVVGRAVWDALLVPGEHFYKKGTSATAQGREAGAPRPEGAGAAGRVVAVPEARCESQTTGVAERVLHARGHVTSSWGDPAPHPACATCNPSPPNGPHPRRSVAGATVLLAFSIQLRVFPAPWLALKKKSW